MVVEREVCIASLAQRKSEPFSFFSIRNPVPDDANKKALVAKLGFPSDLSFRKLRPLHPLIVADLSHTWLPTRAALCSQPLLVRHYTLRLMRLLFGHKPR
jgi:hypothetical protein